MQMPTITKRQSGRKLTSGDMAAGSSLLLLLLHLLLDEGEEEKEQRGANKRPHLYKLRETDDGAVELVLRGNDSRRTGPSNVI